MQAQLDLGTITDLADIQQVNTQIEQFGTTHQLAQPLIFHLTLAMDELVSNFFNYGIDPAGTSPPFMRIRLLLSDDWLITEVQDNGIPFDPLATAPPDLDLSLEEKPIGGLGLHLMKQVIDELSYRREDDCNHLILRQRLAADSAGGPDSADT